MWLRNTAEIVSSKVLCALVGAALWTPVGVSNLRA
jgi:hypothetical protein